MKNKIMAYSDTIDQLQYLLDTSLAEQTAIIVFLDEIQDEPEIPSKFTSFITKFDDCKVIKENYGRCYKEFKDAMKLADFIKEASKTKKYFAVFCSYGQSRSPACVAAIEQYFNQDGARILGDIRFTPNKVVYNKLLYCLTKPRYLQYDSEERTNIITDILEQYDVERFVINGAPKDEYHPEAVELNNIIERQERELTYNDIQFVFRKMLECYINKPLAKKIAKAINVKLNS